LKCQIAPSQCLMCRSGRDELEITKFGLQLNGFGIRCPGVESSRRILFTVSDLSRKVGVVDHSDASIGIRRETTHRAIPAPSPKPRL
jgi:hypothetical protein